MTRTMLELIDELIVNRIDEALSQLGMNTMDPINCRLASIESLEKIDQQARNES